MSSVTTTRLKELAARFNVAALERTREVKEAVRRLDRHVEGLELKMAVAVPTEELDAVLARVRAALRMEREDTLVWRDIRLAVEHFLKLGIGDVARLVEAHARAWPRFVAALFRERGTLASLEWTAWADLLREAPSSIELLAAELFKPVDLLNPDLAKSAQRVARSISCKGLRELAERACKPGLLKKGWNYTAVVFASWIRANGNDRPTWRRIWGELQEDPLLEAFVIPRDPNGKACLGEPGRDIPLGAPDFLLAQATFIATILEWIALPEADMRDEFERIQSIFLRAKDFGDPRTFRDPRKEPEKVGWQQVRKISEKSYEALVERLISADLELFFNQVSFDPDRRDFWLRYKRQVNQTVLCLRPPTKHLLASTLKGPAALGALNRSRDFLTPLEVEAFVLLFPDFFVVEFSAIGNAAFVYPREQFTSVLLGRGAVQMNNLKQQENRDRWAHVQGWQPKFAQRLRDDWGIRPDRAL